MTSVKTFFTSIQKLDARRGEPFEFIHVKSGIDDVKVERLFTGEELKAIFTYPEEEFVQLS